MRLRLRAGRRAEVLAAAVAVGAACLGAVGGGGPAGATALSGGTWGQPQDIPGLAALSGQYPSSGGGSISCVSLGNCTAIGFYHSATTGGNQPFAVTETDGTWGSAVPLTGVPAPAMPQTVSCGAPGYCAASVSYGTGNSPRAYLATEVNGAWSARPLPGTIGSDTVLESGIASVACTGAGDCAVVGWYATTSNIAASSHAFTLDESGGTWGTPEPVAGLPPGGSSSNPTLSALLSVSCSGPGDCTAGGAYNAGSGYAAFVVSESGGTWGSAQAVPGFAKLTSSGGTIGHVTSVSCPDATDCAVAGVYDDGTTGSGSTSYAVFTADEVNGTWKSARALDIPGDAGTPYPNVTVGCQAAGKCVVTGPIKMTVSSGTIYEVIAATETSGGSWGQGQALPGIAADSFSYSGGLSCVPGGGCTLAGYYYPSGTLQSFAATIAADGTIGAVRPTGSTMAKALSCPQDGYCTMVVETGSDAQLLTEANPASVTLKASAPQVSYGTAETFTATVSAAGGTPTGTVTVTGPSGTACTITLVGGTGKCSSSPAQFPVGTDTATGTYNGDLHYVAASATASVTVAKAKTATHLTPSPAVIALGQGTMDTLTVTVSHDGTLAPPGTVQVKDGSDLLCVVILVNGTGNCTVNADQFITHGRVLTATYPGNANFLASTSPPAYLTIAPAAPRLAWPTAGRPASPADRLHGRPAAPVE